MDADRIAAILEFLALADRLKHVLRRGCTIDPATGALRQENSAEHCWNVALVALLLHGEVEDPPDLGHVLAMIAAHDLVEVEAGDTFAYDDQHRLTQAERERAARHRLRRAPARPRRPAARPVGGVRGGRDPGRPLRHGV
jgi:putative hydrolase of HD superfamily